MFDFPLTKAMKSKIVRIGSYVWLFLLDFLQTEIRLLVETLYVS